MDSQKDPRKFTFVQGNGDFDSENRTKLSSSPCHILQSEDSAMNLHGEITRPVLQQLHCLIEGDEDVDYPPPRLITGLPQSIIVDDRTENSKPCNPEISALKAPCLLFTTDEIKNYIDHLETKLNKFHQKMQETVNRINNQQSLLDQQEDELIFYRKLYKTGKTDANETISEDYKILETPPETEFGKFSFGRKLRIEMNQKDVDPNIKEAVDRRIQNILEKTELSQGTSLSSQNSFQNIIYINHEFDDEMRTPTSPICEVPVLLRETDNSILNHVETVSVQTFSSENSVQRNATSQLLKTDIYEVPSQFHDKVEREHTPGRKPVVEVNPTDKLLLQQSKSSPDIHNIQEFETGMKHNGTLMTKEEQQLIEELEKYIGINDPNIESLTDDQTESMMFGKIPYIDMGAVQPKLETSEPTDSIAHSMEKHVRKSRRPVKSAYKSSTNQSMLPSNESMKINKPIISDLKTRIPLPYLCTTGSISSRAFDTKLMAGSEIVSEESQLDRQCVVSNIRVGYSRKPYYQDVDVPSLPKINLVNKKPHIKSNYRAKEDIIVLPKIKSTSLLTPAVSKQNLRHRIKSNILPDKTRPENMPSAGKIQGFDNSTTLRQPNLYLSNRRKERRPGKLPPICNLGIDDTLPARRD